MDLCPAHLKCVQKLAEGLQRLEHAMHTHRSGRFAREKAGSLYRGIPAEAHALALVALLLALVLWTQA